MRLQVFMVLPFLAVCNGIKVPVDRSEEINEKEEPLEENPTQITPIYYVSDDDGANIDSYLIPPNPYTQEAITSDIATPASYLLPPSPGKQPDFYLNPTEPGEQTDWYPIAQASPEQEKTAAISAQSDVVPLQDYKRKSKSHESGLVPVPATGLEPPLVDARNDYFAPPSAVEIPLEVQRPSKVPNIFPLEEIQRPVNVPNVPRYELPQVNPKREYPLNYRPKQKETTLALHLIPPQPANYKIPTKLYPKKFGGEFKPVPIPIAQYLDESALQIPRAKPAKLFKPLPSTETDFLAPTDEKINYLYRKAENKRKFKGEELSQVAPAPSEISAEEPYTYSKYSKPDSTEQEASESINGHPGRNAYPAPLRKPSPAPQHDSAAPAPDERTEFRMHGMKGPHSYQFGFDTGKGKNRQFRFEERDNEGKVQGHYGYMDKHGKLRVVNYSADPKTGFHAEAPVDKE